MKKFKNDIFAVKSFQSKNFGWQLIVYFNWQPQVLFFNHTFHKFFLECSLINIDKAGG